MSGRKWGLAVLALAAIVFAVARLAAPPLPAYRVMTSCDTGTNPAPIGDFVAFAEKHAGEVAYIEFGIEASSHAGDCAIEDNADSEDRAAVSLAPPASGGRWADDGFALVLSAIRDGNIVSIALPTPETMPLGEPLIAHRDWFRYYASGLYVLRHETGNGFEGASFYPLENGAALAPGIACAKRQLKLPAYVAGLLPCF